MLKRSDLWTPHLFETVINSSVHKNFENTMCSYERQYVQALIYLKRDFLTSTEVSNIEEITEKE